MVCCVVLCDVIGVVTEFMASEEMVCCVVWCDVIGVVTELMVSEEMVCCVALCDAIGVVTEFMVSEDMVCCVVLCDAIGMVTGFMVSEEMVCCVLSSLAHHALKSSSILPSSLWNDVAVPFANPPPPPPSLCTRMHTHCGSTSGVICARHCAGQQPVPLVDSMQLGTAPHGYVVDVSIH
jgi:hypothetical protein